MPYTPPGPPLGSKILTVNPNGGAMYTTIGAALAVAVSGDNVVIAPGTYNEGGLTIPSGVGLIGLSSDPYQQTILDDLSSSTIITMNGGRLANIYVQTDSTQPYTIVLSNSGSNYITNCSLYGWASDTNAAHYGVKSTGSTISTITKSIIVMEDGYNSAGSSARKFYGVYHGSSGYFDLNTTDISVYEYIFDPSLYATYVAAGSFMTARACTLSTYHPNTYTNAYAAYAEATGTLNLLNTLYIGQLFGVGMLSEVVHSTGTLAAFRSPIWQAALATELVQQIRAAASQSANLQEWQSSAGAVYSTISENGYVTTRKTAAPADAELANGEMAFWLDATVGATKAMFKAKDSSGNVRSGSLALA